MTPSSQSHAARLTVPLAVGLLGGAWIVRKVSGADPARMQFGSTLTLAIALVALGWLAGWGRGRQRLQPLSRVVLWVTVAVGVVGAWLFELFHVPEAIGGLRTAEWGVSLLIGLLFAGVAVVRLLWDTPVRAVSRRINPLATVYAALVVTYVWGLAAEAAASHFPLWWGTEAQRSIPDMAILGAMLWFTPWTHTGALRVSPETSTTRGPSTSP